MDVSSAEVFLHGLKDETREVNILSDENMEETDLCNDRIKILTCIIVQTESLSSERNLRTTDAVPEKGGDAFDCLTAECTICLIPFSFQDTFASLSLCIVSNTCMSKRYLVLCPF